MLKEMALAMACQNDTTCKGGLAATRRTFSREGHFIKAENEIARSIMCF